MLTRRCLKVASRPRTALGGAALLMALTVVVMTLLIHHGGGRPVASGANQSVSAAAPAVSPTIPLALPLGSSSLSTEAAQPQAETAADTGPTPVDPTATAPPSTALVVPSSPSADPTEAPAPAAARVAPTDPATDPATDPGVPGTPGAPIGQSLPLGYAGSASQVVTVVAPSPGSTSAIVTAWNRNDDGSWSAAVGPVSADIGSDGIGDPSESVSRTPAGTYALTQAFGSAANPGTRLSYFQTGLQDWWDENPDSPTYNRHVVQVDSPGGASENLYEAGSVYRYAITIDYNTDGVPGAGSAFFLHVTDGSATAGCVAIAQGSLVQILQWIAPGAVIVLGVG